MVFNSADICVCGKNTAYREQQQADDEILKNSISLTLLWSHPGVLSYCFKGADDFRESLAQPQILEFLIPPTKHPLNSIT